MLCNLFLFVLFASVRAEPAPSRDCQQSASTRNFIPDLSRRTVILSVDDGYRSVYTNIYPLLKRYNMPITLGVICNYIRKGEPPNKPRAEFMNRAEIQELIDSCNIEIASHSLSHPFLTRIDSTEAWREISRSKSILESLFNIRVITFIYPYGDMNAEIRQMVKSAGYKLGRAVRPGNPDLSVKPYRLPTIELRRETKLAVLKQRIAKRDITILLLHQIVPEPTVFTQWNLADFTELMDWMHHTNIRVITLSELYQEWKRMAVVYPTSGKKMLFKDININATQALYPR